MRRTVSLVTALAVACSTNVEPTNPYDPASPADRLAPATVTGVVAGERPDGSTGPVAGALVAADAGGAAVLTDALGAFSLTLASGSHLVRVAKDGYAPATIPVLGLAIGEVRVLAEPLGLTLSRGRISGRVRLADRDDAGGTQVGVTGTGLATVTAADGRFELDRVLAGTQEVVAWRDGYARTVLGTVTVTADQVVPAGDHVLPRVDGRVTIAEGPATRSRTVTLLTVGGAAVKFRASEDPTFTDPAKGDAGLTSRPYPPVAADAAFTLRDLDGEHLVYVAFSDGTSWGPPSTARVVLDRVPPAGGSVVIGPGLPYTRTPDGIVPLALSAADLPPAGTQAAVSGLARMVIANAADFSGAVTLDYNVAAAWPLATGTSDGPKQVFVKFVDAAGNESAATSASVVRDTLAPGGVTFSLSGPAPAPAGTSGSPFVTAHLAASDANGGAGGSADLQLMLSNDAGLAGGQWLAFQADSAWALVPGDGPKTVWAQVRDGAGNVAGPVPATIELAETPPRSATLQLASGAPRTASSPVLATISAVGADEMLVSVDGTPEPLGWRDYGTAALVDLGAGDEQSKVVTVRFRNAARVEGASASASIYLDRTPPAAGSLSLTGTLANGTTSTALTATPVVVAAPVRASGDAAEMALAQSADPGCAGAFAAPVWQPFAAQATFVLSASGPDPKIVCLLFRDATGNFDPANVASAAVTLDTQAPANPVFLDLSSGVQRAPTVTARASPIAAGEVYQCIGGQHGADWTDCGTSPAFTFTLQPNSENTLGVRARDAAFNVSAGSIARVVHDDVPPVPPFITALLGAGASLNVSWSASTSRDVASYAVSYGTSPGDTSGTGASQGPSAVQVGVATSLRLDGLVPGQAYYVSVTATDAAGNVSEPSGERVIVPDVVSPRVLSMYGAEAASAGLVVDGAARRAYVAQRQGVVQLDVAGEPQKRGRVSLPGILPHRGVPLPVLGCTVDGAAGDCVYVAGSTLEADYRTDPTFFRTGVSVVFFPAAAAAGVGGRPVASLDARAEHVLLSPDRQTLFAIEATQVRAYSVAVASGPVPLGKPLPFLDPAGEPVRRMSRVHGAGVLVEGAARALYVLATPAGGTPSLYRFDATAPAAMTATPGRPLATRIGTSLSTRAYPSGSGTSTLDPVALFGGGLTIAYETIDLSGCPGGSARWFIEVGEWTPGGAAWASGRPETTFEIASGTFGCTAADPNYLKPSERLAPVGASGAGASYVFTSPIATTGLTVHRIVPGGGGLARQWATTTPLAYGSAWSAVASPGVGGADDDLLFVGNGADLRSKAFRLAAGTAPGTASVAFAELFSDTFAAADGYVFMSPDGRTLHSLDISNPLDPQLVATRDGPGSFLSRPMLATGRLLAVVSGGQVLLYAVRPGGVLVARGSVAAAGSVNGLALAGGTLYTSGSALQSWDVSQAADLAVAAPAYPQLASFTPPSGVFRGVDVRGAYVHVVGESGSVPFFKVLTPDGGGSFTTLSTTTIATGGYLTVRGTIAVASSSSRSEVLDLANPAAPVLRTARYDVAGPLVVEGGYLVGPAPSPASGGLPDSGPHFVGLDGTLHGAQPFLSCGAGASYYTTSFASDRGVYVSPCNRNGLVLVTAVNPGSGGQLADVPIAVHRGSFATDEAYSPLALDGSVAHLAAGNGQHRSDLAGLASGAVGVPALLAASYAGRPASYLTAKGTLWSFETEATLPPGTSSNYLVSYDVGRTGAPRTGHLALGPTDQRHATAPVVSDGTSLYAATGRCYDLWTGSGYVPRCDVPTLWALDVRAPAAPAIQTPFATGLDGKFSSLALQRRRLYAAFSGPVPSATGTVTVWDVETLATATRLADVPVARTAAEPLGMVPMSRLRDVAVSGALLAFTYDGAAGYAPYGIGFARLGPGGDGAGATLLGTVESALPFGSPVVSGDLLYARHNAGLATFDLTPWLQRGAAPRYLGSRKTAEILYPYSPARLEVEGPFAFLLVSSFRVFDLR